MFNISTIISSAALKVHILVIDINGNQWHKRHGHATFTFGFITFLELTVWEKISWRQDFLTNLICYFLLKSCWYMHATLLTSSWHQQKLVATLNLLCSAYF